MKKIHLLALLLLVIAFGGCSKTSGDDYFVSFSVNGTNQKFTGYVAAHKEQSGAVIELTMVGATSAVNDDNYFGIYLNNYPGWTDFVTGEYNDASTNFTVLATYGKNGIDYEAGQTVAQEAAANGVILVNRFKVTITSISAESVKGTFSGDFYEDGDVVSGGKFTITNGEFHAKFQ